MVFWNLAKFPVSERNYRQKKLGRLKLISSDKK
jgi:hypothetical protein